MRKWPFTGVQIDGLSGDLLQLHAQRKLGRGTEGHNGVGGRP